MPTGLPGWAPPNPWAQPRQPHLCQTPMPHHPYRRAPAPASPCHPPPRQPWGLPCWLRCCSTAAATALACGGGRGRGTATAMAGPRPMATTTMTSCPSARGTGAGSASLSSRDAGGRSGKARVAWRRGGHASLAALCGRCPETLCGGCHERHALRDSFGLMPCYAGSEVLRLVSCAVFARRHWKGAAGARWHFSDVMLAQGKGAHAARHPRGRELRKSRELRQTISAWPRVRLMCVLKLPCDRVIAMRPCLLASDCLDATQVPGRVSWGCLPSGCWGRAAVPRSLWPDNRLLSASQSRERPRFLGQSGRGASAERMCTGVYSASISTRPAPPASDQLTAQGCGGLTNAHEMKGSAQRADNKPNSLAWT